MLNMPIKSSANLFVVIISAVPKKSTNFCKYLQHHLQFLFVSQDCPDKPVPDFDDFATANL